MKSAAKKPQPVPQTTPWVACHDTIVCMGAKSIQKWCVRVGDDKGPLVAVMLTKPVAMMLAAAPEMAAALHDCIDLVDDMSKFIGVMSLPDYQLFNEAPMKARSALRKMGGAR